VAFRSKKSTETQSKERSLTDKRGRGASATVVGIKGAIRAYLLIHLQAVIFSLGQIRRSPASSLMTIAVIGIALALPSGLHLVLKNIQDVSAGWDSASQVSLFLKKDLSDSAVKKLANRLREMREIEAVVEINPQRALQEFRQISDFGDALNTLQENPFPTVLIVEPASSHSAPAAVEALLLRLKIMSGVELAQLDMEWLQRWYALMEIIKRAVLVLAVLLSLAVLLIIGNTIRLAIQSRREEIEVQKLIGATDAFIRRPFIYSGIWHGLIGAFIAFVLINTAVWMLDDSVKQLSQLYGSDFSLHSMSLAISVLLLLMGILLGYLGSRLSVGHHLRDIEPS